MNAAPRLSLLPRPPLPVLPSAMSSPSPPCATQLTAQPLLPSSVRLSAIALTRPASAPVRDRTDTLDAADNTTAAIGSAALVSLSLIYAYTVRTEIAPAKVRTVALLALFFVDVGCSAASRAPVLRMFYVRSGKVERCLVHDHNTSRHSGQ